MNQDNTAVLEGVRSNYVELIDSMGDDLTVVNSARVSFNKESEFDYTNVEYEWGEYMEPQLKDSDEGLIKYLATHSHWTPFSQVQLQFRIKMPIAIARQYFKHCFSEDTEVLTSSGFRYFKDITYTDLIAAVNEDNTFSFQQPIDIIKNKYKGDMIEFKTNSVDLCVTPEHRMIVQSRKCRDKKKFWSQTDVVLAKDLLKGEHKIPPPGCYNFKERGDQYDFYYGLLYGMFLGDGSCSYSSSKSNLNRIVFGVRKKKKKQILNKISDKLFLNYKINNYTGRSGYSNFWFDNPDKDLFKGKCHSKSIDIEYCLTKSKRFNLGLLLGLRFSDGTKVSENSFRYSTVSKDLAESAAFLGQLLGFKGSINKHRNQYTVNLKRKSFQHLLNRKIIPYDGYVYCVTVDTGRLIVRRNGKISLCGNCVGFTRNEVSRRYVSYDPEFFMPDIFRGKPLDGAKQGSGYPIKKAYEDNIKEAYLTHMRNCATIYKSLLEDFSVAPEQARMVLPQCMMTEFIETGSLAAYARLVKLRTDPHAQKEIQEYAGMISKEIRKVAPVSWKYLIGEDNE